MCNGMSVFVCALRHLYSHMAIKWRGDPSVTEDKLLEQIRGEEAENPVLRFAWSFFTPSRESLMAQNRMMGALSSHLLEGDFGIADLSFLSLMESPLMYKTLLQREPFQLYYPYPLSQPIREGVEEPDKEWDVDDGRRDVLGMAKCSLITWNGQGDLGDFITSKFGIKAAASLKMRYLWMSNKPAVIRVHYHAPASNPPRFYDLKNISIDGQRPRPIEGTRSAIMIDTREKGSLQYILVAAIRLRNGPKEKDTIRRYSTDGQEIPAPSDYPFANPDWRVGDPGRQYMLFYTEMPKHSTGVRLGEVAWRPEGAERNMRDTHDWVRRTVALNAAEGKKGGGS